MTNFKTRIIPFVSLAVVATVVGAAVDGIVDTVVVTIEVVVSMVVVEALAKKPRTII